VVLRCTHLLVLLSYNGATLHLFSSYHRLTKRGKPWGNTWCGCGSDLDHTDTDAAVADLKSQLTKDGNYTEPGLAYYSFRGGVVALACNLDFNAYLHFWEESVTQAAGQDFGCIEEVPIEFRHEAKEFLAA
jgi:hypothetical protein